MVVNAWGMGAFMRGAGSNDDRFGDPSGPGCSMQAMTFLRRSAARVIIDTMKSFSGRLMFHVALPLGGVSEEGDSIVDGFVYALNEMGNPEYVVVHCDRDA